MNNFDEYGTYSNIGYIIQERGKENTVEDFALCSRQLPHPISICALR